MKSLPEIARRYNLKCSIFETMFRLNFDKKLIYYFPIHLSTYDYSMTRTKWFIYKNIFRSFAEKPHLARK